MLLSGEALFKLQPLVKDTKSVFSLFEDILYLMMMPDWFENQGRQAS